MSKEAMKLALETSEGIVNADWRKWDELASPEEFERWVKSRANHMASVLREALAEQKSGIKQVIELYDSPDQPAQQEPFDKHGSPCPEFWDWLPKAYNFDGDGTFTKYNMEVAFLAGKQSVATSDTSQERVDEMQKQRHDTSPPAQRKPLTSQERDAQRWRFLMENSYDSESVTQFHVWEHSWEPHSQTGEPTEWKQRVRGIALIDFIDRAIEAAPDIKENT